MNNPFNPNICNSIKSKKERNIQCSNKMVNNEHFCRMHLKTKYTEVYKPINDNCCNDCNNDCNDCNENINERDKNIHNVSDITNNKTKELRETLYTKEDFFNLFKSNKCNNLSVFTLRNNIKNLGLQIITKQSKPELINSVQRLLKYYDNIDKIVVMQSIIRRWLVMRRSKCCNKQEITSFDSIYDIASSYFYLFKDDTNGMQYGYDIRSLVSILKSDYPSCPYTYRNFTDSEKEKINRHVAKLKLKGINIEFEKLDLTPEQEMEMRMKNIFHKINMLDNYTSHTWFNDLSLTDLIKLYSVLEDIWNYRLGMTPEARRNILPSYNGNAFMMSYNFVKRIKNKLNIQDILLTEIDKFISDGINRDERKLGAMLILTGLVEVSDDAADGLPHLIPY